MNEIESNVEKLRKAQELSGYLNRRSQEICRDNDCTDDQHNCESYAYIDSELNLLGICISDYFQGCSRPHAAIPMPWNGTPTDLAVEVENQCEDFS